jgi:hypothetical protein
MSGGKKTAPVTTMKKPAADGAGKTTEMSIEDHVAMHGPAHKVEYHHDKATGKHHVTSHHGQTEGGMSASGGGEPSGGEEKQHHSVHDTQAGAHEHIGKSMGMDNTSEKQDDEFESPDSSMGSTTMTRHGGGSKGIPGIG